MRRPEWHWQRAAIMPGDASTPPGEPAGPPAGPQWYPRAIEETKGTPLTREAVQPKGSPHVPHANCRLLQCQVMCLRPEAHTGSNVRSSRRPW